MPSTSNPNFQATLDKYWSQTDVNSNGYISLAETDKGLRDVIRIPAIFDTKPVIIRAFNAAKNALKAKSSHGDDYVSKAEFIYLISYLRQYYKYWNIFDEVDSSDDRRISREEFAKAQPTFKKYGVNIQNVNELFNKIDTNNGGIILFDEFCDWIIKDKLKVE